MTATPAHSAHLSCCSAPTTPVVRLLEDPAKPSQNQLLDNMQLSFQKEFASFRKALQTDIEMSHKELKQQVQQAIEHVISTTKKEEKAVYHSGTKCPASSPRKSSKLQSDADMPQLPEECASAKVDSLTKLDNSKPDGSVTNSNRKSVPSSAESHRLQQSDTNQVTRQESHRTTATTDSHRLSGVWDPLNSVIGHHGSDPLNAAELAVTEQQNPGVLVAERDRTSSLTIKKPMWNLKRQLVSMDELDKPIYDVSLYYYESGVFRTIATSECFQNFTMAMICFNSLYLGIDANENKADSLLEAKWYFFVCENFFCVFFTAEWMIRFFAFKKKRDCLRDMWFKFDSALVLLMISETWLLLFLAGSVSLPTGPLRLFRLLRLARMTRLMRALPELVTMVKGLLVASRAVGSSLLMVIILVYVFAIAMHSFLNESKPLRSNFSTIPNCMWTLLIDGVFMDSTGSLLWTMIRKGEVLGLIVFLFFILLSSMTVMNMLIGVLCEVVSRVAEAEKENDAIHQVKSSLLIMLKRLDQDGSGDISKEELLGVLRDESALDVLDDIEVDCKYLLRVMAMKYDEDPTMAIPEIIELILNHRGDRDARVQDVIGCHAYTRWCIHMELEQQTRTLQEIIEDLRTCNQPA